MMTKQQLVERLYRCPFCNSRLEEYNIEQVDNLVYISCKCGARSKKVAIEPEVCAYEELAKYWNTRKNDLAPDGKVMPKNCIVKYDENGNVIVNTSIC